MSAPRDPWEYFEREIMGRRPARWLYVSKAYYAREYLSFQPCVEVNGQIAILPISIPGIFLIWMDRSGSRQVISCLTLN